MMGMTMDQIDATALLKAKVEDRNPKCASCAMWSRLPGSSVGSCARAGANMVIHTADLTVCSDWSAIRTS